MRRVQLLQDALGKAIVIAKEATQRIEEFQIQLSILQRQCSARDRPFCDTLRLRGFEDNGILNTLTRVRWFDIPSSDARPGFIYILPSSRCFCICDSCEVIRIYCVCWIWASITRTRSIWTFLWNWRRYKSVSEISQALSKRMWVEMFKVMMGGTIRVFTANV